VVAALGSYMKDRAPRVRTKKPRRERATPRRTRHIPAAVRDEVFLRDGERCTFVGTNGNRCNATHGLQIDHIVPFAHGGTHDPENLRTLCGAHNRMLAKDVFGVRRERE
jgi:5-methylcytosine-specific restriction endonuclease McrA